MEEYKASRGWTIFVWFTLNKDTCYVKSRNLKTKGDYIIFLDRDDVWYEDKLMKELYYLLAKKRKISIAIIMIDV